ncbi:hypothetical protein KI387_013964, partial [Taxus chinensis]
MDYGISTFLERMAGHSTLVSYAVMETSARGRVQIGNTIFHISMNAIAAATSLSAAGDIYSKCSLQEEVQYFTVPGEIL